MMENRLDQLLKVVILNEVKDRGFDNSTLTPGRFAHGPSPKRRRA